MWYKLMQIDLELLIKCMYWFNKILISVFFGNLEYLYPHFYISVKDYILGKEVQELKDTFQSLILYVSILQLHMPWVS